MVLLRPKNHLMLLGQLHLANRYLSHDKSKLEVGNMGYGIVPIAQSHRSYFYHGFYSTAMFTSNA